MLRILTARWLRLAPEAGALFALHAEAERIYGIDVRADDVVDAHARALTTLLLGPSPTA